VEYQRLKDSFLIGKARSTRIGSTGDFQATVGYIGGSGSVIDACARPAISYPSKSGNRSLISARACGQRFSGGALQSCPSSSALQPRLGSFGTSCG
jgi:hypothetical protein